MSWWDFGESAFEKWTREQLLKIHKEVLKMSQALDLLKQQVATLITAVAAEGDAVKAATMAITGLTDQQALLTVQLQEAIDANDPEAIQAAADAIAEQNNAIVEQTAALSAAIPANTASRVK